VAERYEVMETPQEGSISYVTQRLLRFISLQPHGFAQIAFTSEFSRQEVLKRLRAHGISIDDQIVVASQESPHPAPLIDVWNDSSAAAGVQLRSLSLAAVPGAEKEFIEAVSRLNVHRESIGEHPATFALWLPPTWQHRLIDAIPDFDSWTMLRLNLSESVSSPATVANIESGEIFRPLREETQAREQRLITQAKDSNLPELWLKNYAEAVDLMARGGNPRQAALLAHQALQAVQSFQPRDWKQFAQRASLYAATQQHPKSIEDLEAALNSLDLAGGEMLAQDELALQRSSILTRLSRSFSAIGDFHRAQLKLEESISILEAVLGPNDLSVISSIDQLAQLLIERGRLIEAESLLLRALNARKTTLGPGHPITITSVGNLASLYLEQGRYSEAEPLLQQAASRFAETQGSEHPAALSALNNLANYYRATGRPELAYPIQQQVLQSREKVMGATHRTTLHAMSNLANLCSDLGRLEEAEPLLTRATNLMESLLGPDHPDTLLSLNNLAALYSLQRRYDESERILRRVLETRQKKLGHEHPQTLISLGNLGELYRLQGRFDRSEAQLAEAVGGLARILGENHPYTQTARKNLENANLKIKSP
jgi:tetratricopeptide (TPR) repeat protein